MRRFTTCQIIWKAIALGNVHRSLKPGGRFFRATSSSRAASGNIESKVDMWIDGYKAVDEKLHLEATGHMQRNIPPFPGSSKGCLRAGFPYRVIAGSNNFMAYLCAGE
jgi:hypothetical protein